MIDRAARARAAMPPPPTPADDAWLYKLSKAVPEHQVPLVPVRTSGEDGEGRYLQRGRLEVSADEEGVETRGALGRILEPDTALLIHDEEVPATGARVTRTWQMARTGNGGVVVWVGRKKSAGRPMRSPGLVFDEVIQSAPPAWSPHDREVNRHAHHSDRQPCWLFVPPLELPLTLRLENGRFGASAPEAAAGAAAVRDHPVHPRRRPAQPDRP